MVDEARTRDDLEGELAKLRRQIAELEAFRDGARDFRRREARFRWLTENVSDVIWSTDVNLRFTYFSPSVTRLRGYTAEEAMGKTLPETFTPSSSSALVDALRSAFTPGSAAPEGDPRTRLLRLEEYRRDGSTVWVETKLTFLRGQDGGPSGVVAVERDITQRKRMEEELALASVMLQTVNEAIFSTDSSLKIGFWNREAENQYGWKADEVLGQDWHELLGVTYSHTDRESAMAELFKNGYWRGEVRARRKDGAMVDIVSSCAVLRGQEGALAGVVVTSHDITARKEAENRIRESEEKYRGLYDTMAQGVVYQDSEGRALAANPAAQAILGLTLHQILGRSSFHLQPRAIHEDGSDFPADTHPPVMALKTGEVVKGVVMGIFNPRDRARRWLDVSAVPQFRPGAKTPHRVFITFTDITERKRAEETIKRLAFYDQVTDLPNRVLFHDRLDIAIHQARRDRKAIAVMMLDLDGFKRVNDAFGHEFGDRLLRSTGQRLKGLLRAADSVGRIGGDEFMVLLGGINGRADATTVAQKIVAAFKTPFVIDGRELRITASIGVAAHGGHGCDANELVRDADIAMYQAKAKGGDRWQWSALSEQALGP